MNKHLLPALLLGLSLGGCAEARIAMPGDLIAATEQLELTGMGGWQGGRFHLGSSAGEFDWHGRQTRVFDSFVRNAGSGSFEVTGPEFGGTLTGRCGFEERELDLGVAVLPDERLSYQCRFDRAGKPVDGALFLAEVPRGSGLFAGRSRAGELRMGDFTLDIRPIHHAAGGGLPTSVPLGYAFSSGGRQLGALDLNGTNKTVYAPRQPGSERNAVLLASLALSIFQDPGE
jgi:hypothetical protein